MISYIRLVNFKSFENITLDLRGPHGIPKKNAFIYGENGSGKSNLILAMLFIRETFGLMELQMSQGKLDMSAIGDMMEKATPEELMSILMTLRAKAYTLSELIDRYWTIGNEDPMEIEIGFFCDGKNGHYLTRFSRERVIKESMYYTVNERAGMLFDIAPSKITLSPSVFTEVKYRQELVESVEKFWGKHTFVSLLFGEIQAKNMDYIKKRVSGSLIKPLDMLRRISVSHKGMRMDRGYRSLPYSFMHNLNKGWIRSKEDKQMRAFEQALNVYFTQLYSDVKKVYYGFEEYKEGYRYELYFDKLCGGRLRSIPVSQESTGTQKLLEIFPMLFVSTMDTTVFIDEVDSGIHDLLMKEVISVFRHALNETNEGQFIATTHNTLLMESLAPENIYILRSEVDGEKRLDCVKDYQFRTHKNNSIRQKYLHGFYQGVPEIGYLDFGEIVLDSLEQMRNSDENEEE